MDFKFKESIAPIKKVVGIQFGVMSPKYIEDISVTKEYYDKNCKKIESGIFDQNNIYDPVTKKPIIGGINDPRMGNIIDLENPGYFGHIKLARPVYHYGFLNIILNILRCVSFYTSKLIISDKDLNHIITNVKKKKRLKEISKLSTKVKTCKDTKRGLPHYSKEGLKIVVEHSDPVLQGSYVGKRTLSTLEAYSILEKISDEDVVKLGLNPEFCRPEWMLITYIPIPPPHVRPSVSMSVTQKCEDDLTHKINDILKSNIALQTAISNNNQPHIIEQFENLLQYHISTYFDNKIPGQKPSQQRSGKPLKTLRQRLVGKEGRIRGNLMGKRVDFSARTVLTGDPNLCMDQVGVPLEIAINLTIPEKVYSNNITKLQNLVNNGPHNHPGAKYVIIDSKKIDLNYVKTPITLKIGDIVERHLDNDDVIMFNRQPSLHKMSLMGHRVKVLNSLTFRINLSTCTPYNADFDGDEMNLHVPQSLSARSEIENLMMVQNMIVGPQSNRPMMGIIQDALLSSSLLTKRSVFINKQFYMNTIMNINKIKDDDDIIKKDDFIRRPTLLINTKNIKNIKTTGSGYIKLWTGKQLFSHIIPHIQYRKNSNEAPDNDDEMTFTDTRVVIKDGLLISGILDKKSIGITEGSIIHIMFNDFGPERTRVFMDRIQTLANYWILNNSFSIGIGDTVVDSNTHTSISNIIENVKQKVNNLILNKHTTPAKLEQEINIELNGARDEAGHLVHKTLNQHNNFKSTISAGSKGNNLNISQIIACVGQQNIEGKRVAYGFNNRTLPHYEKNDIGYESRGFIENSYISGLTPQEFFYHHMAGREGIIDTSCKTSDSGYTQRKLIKALEDLSIKYDNTVRDSYNNIIQFKYGEDGIDATFIESQEINILHLTYEEFTKKFLNIPATELMLAEFNQLVECRRQLYKIFYSREPNGAKLSDKMIPLPVNLKRLLQHKDLNTIEGKIMNQDSIINEINKFIEKLDSNQLMNINIRINLSSKNLLGINDNQLAFLLYEIETRYNLSKITVGEMVGIIAAQSLSAPLMQLTLNTFHSTGISSKNVTLGIPRLKELINLSKNNKSPTLTIYTNEQNVDIKNKLEFKNMKNFIKKSSVIDSKLKYEEISNIYNIGRPFDISSSCLYIEIDNELLEYTNITLFDIYNKIITDKKFRLNMIKNIYIEIGDDNMDIPFIKIYIKDPEPDSDIENILKDFEINYLYKIDIQGIPGINKVFTTEKNLYTYDEKLGLQKEKIKVIETEGTNLLEIFKIPEINYKKVISNNIIEVYDVLGIEAARKTLLNELRMILSFDGSYVNYRHIGILVDIMTYKGTFMSMTRHGINRSDNSTLMKCSFEETVEILIDAAVYSQKDLINGVSENIMLGQMVPCGTGAFDVLFDNNYVYKKEQDDIYIPSSPVFKKNTLI